MLTRSCSLSVASSLQEMPGATSSHFDSVRPSGAGTNGSLPVSAAMRRASSPHSGVDGLRRSAGDDTTSMVVGNGVRRPNCSRSIALDCAWFMIQPTTEPPAGSYVDALRHPSWHTSRVSSSAISQLLTIRVIHVKTMPYVCVRSEEHTSELQSHSDLVCRLLLEITLH